MSKLRPPTCASSASPPRCTSVILVDIRLLWQHNIDFFQQFATFVAMMSGENLTLFLHFSFSVLHYNVFRFVHYTGWSECHGVPWHTVTILAPVSCVKLIFIRQFSRFSCRICRPDYLEWAELSICINYPVCADCQGFHDQPLTFTTFFQSHSYYTSTM